MKVYLHVIKVPAKPLGVCLPVLALAGLGAVPLSPPQLLCQPEEQDVLSFPPCPHIVCYIF